MGSVDRIDEIILRWTSLPFFDGRNNFRYHLWNYQEWKIEFNLLHCILPMDFIQCRNSWICVVL